MSAARGKVIQELKEDAIKQEAFADDLNGAGKLFALKVWWDTIREFGPCLGYFAKPSKSWLIVKQQYLDLAKSIFTDACYCDTSCNCRGIHVTVNIQQFHII